MEYEVNFLLESDAENNPVGKGREEPNRDPFLKDPEKGREGVLNDITEGLSQFNIFRGLYDSMANCFKIIGLVILLSVISYIVQSVLQILR